MSGIILEPKQSLVFTTKAKFIGFGGQAGGGKSLTIRALTIAMAMEVPEMQIYVIRKSLVQLRQGFMQGPTGYPALLHDLIESGHVRINYTELKITFWNKAVIILKQLADEHDLDSFLGLEVNFACFDEATTLKPEHIRAVLGRLRTGSLKVPDKWKHKGAGALLCTNPGGPSHDLFKKWFINKAPPMTEFVADEEFGGGLSMFIPCSLWENPHLDQEDYAAKLKAAGDPTRVRQLLYGDFDAGISGFFSDAFKREKNVIPDFKLPEDWVIERSYDPGYSSPFGYVLIARVKGQNEVTFADGTTRHFPNGSRIVYREWYGYNGKDENVGLKWTHEEIAQTMRDKEEGWGLKGRIRPGRADWKIWDGELNVYSVYEKHGVTFIKADKAKGSRTAGALKMRRMMFAAHTEPAEEPGLYFVASCIHCISTIPSLPADPSNPDDVVTEGVPDHLYDAVRYSIMGEAKQMVVVKTVGL